MPIQNCELFKSELVLKEYILIRNRAAVITLLAAAILAALFPIALDSPYFVQSVSGIALIFSIGTLTNLAFFTLLSTLCKIYSLFLQLQSQKEIAAQQQEAQALIEQQDAALRIAEEPLLVAAAVPQQLVLPDLTLYPDNKNFNDITKVLILLKRQLAPLFHRLSGDNVTRDLFVDLIDHIIADLPHFAKTSKQCEYEMLDINLSNNRNYLLQNGERLFPEQLNNQDNSLTHRIELLKTRQNLLIKRAALLTEQRLNNNQKIEEELEENLALVREHLEEEERHIEVADELYINYYLYEVTLANKALESLHNEIDLSIEISRLEKSCALLRKRLSLLAKKESLPLEIAQANGQIVDDLKQYLSFPFPILDTLPPLIQRPLNDAAISHYNQNIEEMKAGIIRMSQIAGDPKGYTKAAGLIREATDLIDEIGKQVIEDPAEQNVIKDRVATFRSARRATNAALDTKLDGKFAETIQDLENAKKQIAEAELQMALSPKEQEAIVKLKEALIAIAAIQNTPIPNFPLFPMPQQADIPRNHFAYLAHIFQLWTLTISFVKICTVSQLESLPLSAKTMINQPNATKKLALWTAIKGARYAAGEELPKIYSPSDPTFNYVEHGINFGHTVISNFIDKYFNVTTWHGWVPVPGFGLSDRAFDDLNLFIPILNNLSEVALQLAAQEEPYTQEILIKGVVDAALTPLNQTLWK